MLIYGLIDPRNSCLRYVGQTSTLAKRLNEHVTDKARTHKTNWVKSLLKLNLKPTLEVLEEVPDDQADDVERFWIASVRATGAQLLNMTDGGDGVEFTREVRAKLSASNKGKRKGIPKSEEHKAKIRASNLKTWADPNKRAAHGRINSGRKHTPESKKNFSDGQLRRYGWLPKDAK